MNLDEYRAMVEEEKNQSTQTEVVENAQTEPSAIESVPQAEPEATEVQPVDAEPTSQETTQIEPEVPTSDVYRVDDREYTKSQVEEALTLQSKFIEERKALEEQKREMALQQQYYEAIQKDEAFAQKFAETYNLPFLTKEQQEIKKLNDNYNMLLVKNELAELKANYGDVNEREVIEFAVQRNLATLDDAYNLLQVEKQRVNPRSEAVDVEALKEQIRQEVQRELESKVDTGTIISSRNTTKPVTDDTPTLSPQELKVARNLKMSPTEYAKWRGR